MNKEIIKNSSFEPMRCREVDSYLSLFALGGHGMTMDECKAVKYHLQSCSRCAKAYKELDFVINLLQSQKNTLIEKGLFSDINLKEFAKEPTVEESFKELQDKLQRTRIRTSCNKKSKQLKTGLKRLAAFAACLVVGVLGWMAFSNYSKTENPEQNIIAKQTKPPIKVELVKPSGNVTINPNQSIIADNQLKTVLINNKHQMVMNIGTSLSIEPLMANSQLGCLVKLEKGEIYTHVQHDGNPFVVETSNGKAIITGTTFNIKADNGQAELIVTEGTVKFENEIGSVNVKAGQASSLTADSKPTLPTSCDTKSLTAWATGYKPETIVYQQLTELELLQLQWPWPVEERVINLDDVNYENWIGEKENWFKSEFPWIFQFQYALAQKGIETDYPELLIQSGDLWQFYSAEKKLSHFSQINPDSLLNLTSKYNLNKQWLMKNVSSFASSLDNESMPQDYQNINTAFDKWLDIFVSSRQTSDIVSFDILENLFRASTYVANTRTLAWFAVDDNNYKLKDKQKSEVLALLQKQVNLATSIQENALYQPSKEKLRCDLKPETQDKWYQWNYVISENVEDIIQTEKEIKQYEIIK